MTPGQLSRHDEQPSCDGQRARRSAVAARQPEGQVHVDVARAPFGVAGRQPSQRRRARFAARTMHSTSTTPVMAAAHGYWFAHQRWESRRCTLRRGPDRRVQQLDPDERQSAFRLLLHQPQRHRIHMGGDLDERELAVGETRRRVGAIALRRTTSAARRRIRDSRGAHAREVG